MYIAQYKLTKFSDLPHRADFRFMGLWLYKAGQEIFNVEGQKLLLTGGLNQVIKPETYVGIQVK